MPIQKTYSLPEYPDCQLKTELDFNIINIFKKNNITGSALAVIKNNKVILCKGYGFSNLKFKTPMTEETVLRVASISKMITGTAIMQLYEQNKLDIETDISIYLGYKVENPNFPNIPITAKQLLSHTSSLLDSGAYNSILEDSIKKILNFSHFTNIPLKEMLVPDGKYYTFKNFGNYKPGEIFEYCNFGFGILGSIIENVSGERFPEYCKKYIFKPLNMNSSFDPGDIEQFQNIGTLYRPETNPAQLTFIPQQDDYNNNKPRHTINYQPLGNALPYSPAGSLRTSISDLSKFILMLLNNGEYKVIDNSEFETVKNSNKNKKILKSESIAMMKEKHCTGNSHHGLFKAYGLAIQHTEEFLPGIHMIGHASEAYGLIGCAYFIPNKEFAIIELFSGGQYDKPIPFYPVQTETAKLLYQEFFK